MRKKPASGQEEKAPEAFRQYESWLRLIMDNTSDGINIVEYDPPTQRRRLLLCNDRYVEMSGRSREELMEAKNLNELVCGNVVRGGTFREKFQKGLPSEGTASWLRPDGKENTYEWTATMLKVGDKYHVVGIDRDITERMKVEDRLRRLAMIADQAAEGIAMADLDGILKFVNTAWARMHGYETGQELVGQHISVFHTPEQMKTYVNPFNNGVKRTGRHMGESEQLRKDGTTFPSEMAVTLFKDEKDNPIGFLAFAIDITERRQSEDALRKSENDLRKRVRELNCLYRITEVVNTCGDVLDAFLQGIADILPESCQHPANACARITFGRKKYATGNFRKSPWKLAADILMAGEKAGIVEVFFLEEKPTADEKLLLKEKQSLIDAVAERIGKNIELIQARQRLIVEQTALHEKNVALREVMAGIQEEKKELGRRISRNVEKIVMPLLHALEQELPPSQKKYVDLLKGSIEDITLPFADSLSKEFTSLTQTEIRICNLIRRGLSTKDIAGLQHISPATVNKHREHIRRKLRIRNKDTNLATYLENYMSGHAEN